MLRERATQSYQSVGDKVIGGGLPLKRMVPADIETITKWMYCHILGGASNWFWKKRKRDICRKSLTIVYKLNRPIIKATWRKWKKITVLFCSHTMRQNGSFQ